VVTTDPFDGNISDVGAEAARELRSRVDT